MFHSEYLSHGGTLAFDSDLRRAGRGDTLAPVGVAASAFLGFLSETSFYW